MKIGWLNFDGNISDTFGFYTTGKNTHNAPERDVTVFEIKGRNGDFFVDNGRYKNIQVTYPCFAMNFSANEQYIRNRFASMRPWSGWLSDSYDTTHFRRARLVGGIDFEPTRGDAANFELTFDCDPRRFLIAGDEETEITNNPETIINPTFFDAHPQIIVENILEGTEIEVTDSNGKVYHITALDDFADTVYIDSDLQDVYTFVGDATVNKNDLFDMPEGFPVLTSGSNQIGISSSVDYIGIIPRWWEL